jgi:hypothetical protein
MDEENPLPSEQGSAFARILNGNRKRPMKAEHSDH